MCKFTRIITFCVIILLIETAFIYKRYVQTNTENRNNELKNRTTIIVVDVNQNNLSVFQMGKLIKTYKCAGGKDSTPSPIGSWKVVDKGAWGEGFGGSWMGLNVPWGKYGIHGTTHPESIGWNSSHGCIRMRNEDAADVYKITPIGTSVIIWGGPYGNFGNYLRRVKPGDRGADVYELEKILKNRGYYNGYLDGIYGESLKEVIHKFQRENNLPITDTVTIKFYSTLGIYLMD